MHGGLTGFGYDGMHHSLGGLLLGGARTPKVQAKYAKEKPYTRVFDTRPKSNIDLKLRSAHINEVRKQARKVATEQRKRLRQTPGYKLYVKQYQNFLKDIAKNRLQHLTAEESVAIEQAIEMGHGDKIPYMIRDRDQHIRMLKAKHFPMWAAKEYTFDLHKTKKEREFHMMPYSGMSQRAIMPEMVERYDEGSESLVSVPRHSYSSSYVPRVPSGLFSSSGLGVRLPQRRGSVRNARGQFVSPESEEFLQNVSAVRPYGSDF